MRKSYDSEALPELGGALAVDMYTRTSPIRSATQGTSPVPDVPTLLFEPNTLLREGLRRMLADTAYRLVATGSSLTEISLLAVSGDRPFLAIVDAVSDHASVLRQVQELKARTQPPKRSFSSTGMMSNNCSQPSRRERTHIWLRRSPAKFSSSRSIWSCWGRACFLRRRWDCSGSPTWIRGLRSVTTSMKFRPAVFLRARRLSCGA